MKSKRMSLLKVTPDKTIEFTVVPLKNVSVTMQLENVSDSPVAFKIKTTAPKNYLVRPSQGVLQLGASQNIQLVLQPQTEETVNPRDRFLIQAVALEDATQQVVDKSFWADTPHETLQDLRLSVLFKTVDGRIIDGPSSHSAASGPTLPEGAAVSRSITTPPSAPAHVKQQPAGSGPAASVPVVPGGGHPAFDASGAVVSANGASHATDKCGATTPGKQRYDELVQYCLAVEGQKKKLAAKLAETYQSLKSLVKHVSEPRHCQECNSLVQPITALPDMTALETMTAGYEAELETASLLAGGKQSAPLSMQPCSSSSQGFSRWQVVAIVVMVVIALELCHLA